MSNLPGSELAKYACENFNKVVDDQTARKHAKDVFARLENPVQLTGEHFSGAQNVGNAGEKSLGPKR